MSICRVFTNKIRKNHQNKLTSSMQIPNNNINNNSLNNILNHHDPLRAALKDNYPIRLRNKEYSQNMRY